MASKEPEKMDLRSMDVTEDQKRKLREVFPNVFNGDKVDFERLRLSLGDDVETGLERYGMVWPGKAECMKVIQQPSIGTLEPVKKESVDFDTTENILVEGDNLEVLKLLQNSYYEKIKIIYIDPPYNTGREFIYPDKYSESLETYLAYTGQANEEGKKFSTNTEVDGRFHSKWLNMMYPRLYLARNLMREDGVIFISIDDNEIKNLRMLCDEVFGEENFVATVIWQKVYAPKNTARHFSEDHDYIVVYAKRADLWTPQLLERTKEQDELYKNPDDDPRGVWMSDNLTARNYYSEGEYEVVGPTGRKFLPGKGRYWRSSFEKFKELGADKRIWWGVNGDSMPRLKRFLSEVSGGRVPQTLWTYEKVGHTQDAKRELLEFVSFEHTENVLNSVKPTGLIRQMLAIGTSPNAGDIVLDFFAGSGPTGHATLLQNKEDGGNRKFILVQLPEPLPKAEKSVKTISDMTKSRVRNVIKSLNDKDEGELALERKQDRGFRVYKLSESNFKLWNAEVSRDTLKMERQLELHINHIDPKATTDGILYELLSKSGYPLTTKVEEKTLARKMVYSIESGELLICLEKELTKEVITEMARLEPARVICLDQGFSGNDQLKTNAVQIMKSHRVNDFRTV